MSEQPLAWPEFERVQLVAGTIVRVEPFPEARKPAYKVWADLGPVRPAQDQRADHQPLCA